MSPRCVRTTRAFHLVLLGTCWFGCGSSNSNFTDTGGTGGGGGVAGNGAGRGGASQGGTSGSGGAPARGGSAGASGSTSAGTSGTGGTSGSAGTTGAAGGALGTAGSTASGGSAAGGGGGSAGIGSTLKGGASGKFVCPSNGSYGDPLSGMGTVNTISAPTSGSATYFAFIEGPVWVASVNKLFFSDNASSPQERIWVLEPPATTPSVFLEMSGSNGLAVDSSDQLVVADQRNHRIVRVDPKTAMQKDVLVPAGSFTPNDLIVRSDGNLYFTDPNSGGRGLYRVSPSGQLGAAMMQVNAPNGVVLSPDENTLYVGDVNSKVITAFPVGADGTLNAAASTRFATTVGDTLDGMAVDCAGNVYAGTARGVEVFSAAGAVVGTVPTGESSNATFGGADRKTLYVTSRAVLKSVTLAVPGLPD